MMRGKSELRAGALKRRKALRLDQLVFSSGRIQERLLALDEFRRAKVIASYVAKADEVQTRGIIESSLEQGKVVAAVLTDQQKRTLSFFAITSFDDLAPGVFGILEPRPAPESKVDPQQVDLFLVPVVGWDERGYRLGYGHGYFDRTLRDVRGTKIGLALESQLLDNIPQTSYDVPLDIIVTEQRVVRPRRTVQA